MRKVRRTRKGKHKTLELAKPVRIENRNSEKIESLLSEVNERAKKHVFSFYEEISDLAKKAERELDRLYFSRKSRKGTQLLARSGGNFSYGFTATRAKRIPSEPVIRSEVLLTRGPSHWTLDRITRLSAATYQIDELAFSLYIDSFQAMKSSLAAMQARNVFIREKCLWRLERDPTKSRVQEEFVLGSETVGFPMWLTDGNTCLLPNGQSYCLSHLVGILEDDLDPEELELTEEQRKTLVLCLKWHLLVK